ncbi:hypothetical protein CCH79_00016691 [Gambusia affinis]|uniref:Uncharacterized protein n=1 Tax=Gambusia affinis TaxID=33528 RepID=A0A315URE9_GAMAF|nr:hypothetical protein CCH79_00016691 [Gambusia affinis]
MKLSTQARSLMYGRCTRSAAGSFFLLVTVSGNSMKINSTELRLSFIMALCLLSEKQPNNSVLSVPLVSPSGSRCSSLPQAILI